jgi:hypothetical protein
VDSLFREPLIADVHRKKRRSSMLCRIAMLLSLVVCSAALTAFAADADCEAIKRAIVLDSAITYEDLKKIGVADRPPKPDDCEDQSLTFMLFVFVGSDQEKTKEDFKPLKEGRFAPADVAGEVARMRREDVRRIAYEPLTFIHLDRITDCTCTVNGEVAEGVVSFRAPGLYEGKARYRAFKAGSGDWYIQEFSMPSLDINLVFKRDGDRGVWTRKPKER